MLRAPSVANVPISRVMWVGLDGIAVQCRALEGSLQAS